MLLGRRGEQILNEERPGGGKEARKKSIFRKWTVDVVFIFLGTPVSTISVPLATPLTLLGKPPGGMRGYLRHPSAGLGCAAWELFWKGTPEQ